MKKIKIALLTLSLFAGFCKVNAQQEEKKWTFGFGVNMVGITTVGPTEIQDFLGEYFGGTNLNTLPAISNVSVTRSLNKGFGLELNAAINKIDNAPVDVEGLSFFAVDLGATYDLNHLNFIGETGWFDPYLRLGAGMTWLEGDEAFTVHGGFGFNTWFNDTVGLNFSSSYKNSPASGNDFISIDTDGYFHHALGLIFRL